VVERPLLLPPLLLFFSLQKYTYVYMCIGGSETLRRLLVFFRYIYVYIHVRMHTYTYTFTATHIRIHKYRWE
jgi:hypothetical protein